MQISQGNIYTPGNKIPRFFWIQQIFNLFTKVLGGCFDFLQHVREPSFGKFESMLSWNIWRIRSNIGFRPHLRLLIPYISHFDSGNRSGGRYKDILRKTDSRSKGFQASLFILRILAKFLPQMKLFILQISSGSYQNSQLAPSEGHFLGARSPVVRVASSSSRRH